MNSTLALTTAMRNALLAHAPLTLLVGGANVFDELPRGAQAPYVAFTLAETRDWSTADHVSHEHFVTIDVATRERGRAHAEEITETIGWVLDRAQLTLTDHLLVNLHLLTWNVARKKDSTFGATLRFRATTEPI